jgi:hypothetical protein
LQDVAGCGFLSQEFIAKSTHGKEYSARKTYIYCDFASLQAQRREYQRLLQVIYIRVDNDLRAAIAEEWAREMNKAKGGDTATFDELQKALKASQAKLRETNAAVNAAKCLQAQAKAAFDKALAEREAFLNPEPAHDWYRKDKTSPWTRVPKGFSEQLSEGPTSRYPEDLTGEDA